jgi:hypothetical protein
MITIARNMMRMNYPMVGPGCSDDCSVMSDPTTPTVVSVLTPKKNTVTHYHP